LHLLHISSFLSCPFSTLPLFTSSASFIVTSIIL
jgi:hypothetical protein